MLATHVEYQRRKQNSRFYISKFLIRTLLVIKQIPTSRLISLSPLRWSYKFHCMPRKFPLLDSVILNYVRHTITDPNCVINVRRNVYFVNARTGYYYWGQQKLNYSCTASFARTCGCCRRLAEKYSGTFKITFSFFSIFVVTLFVCLFFLKGQIQKTFRNSRDSCYSSNVPDTTATVRDGFFLGQERLWDNQTRVRVEISLQVAVAMEMES